MTSVLRKQMIASMLILSLVVGMVGMIPARTEATAPVVANAIRQAAAIIVGVIVAWELEPLKEHYEAAKDSIKQAWEDTAEHRASLIEVDKELNPRSQYVQHCGHARCGYY